MGRDKALVEVGGRPMAAIAAAALAGAGAVAVAAVGGDAGRLSAAGLATVPDRWPGAGPVGGIVTALAALGDGVDAVVVVACDLPRLGPATVGALVAALAAAPLADAAVADVGGRRQWLVGAWRPACGPRLAGALAGGERAVRRAASGLAVVGVPADDPAEVADADEPGDLPGHEPGHEPGGPPGGLPGGLPAPRDRRSGPDGDPG